MISTPCLPLNIRSCPTLSLYSSHTVFFLSFLENKGKRSPPFALGCWSASVGSTESAPTLYCVSPPKAPPGWSARNCTPFLDHGLLFYILQSTITSAGSPFMHVFVLLDYTARCRHHDCKSPSAMLTPTSPHVGQGPADSGRSQVFFNEHVKHLLSF